MEHLTDASPDIARRKLRKAVKDCSERGLYFASKWFDPFDSQLSIIAVMLNYNVFVDRAAELLVAVPQEPQASTSASANGHPPQSAAEAAFTSTPARSRRLSLFPGLPPTVARAGTDGGLIPGSPDQSSFALSPFAQRAQPSAASRSEPTPADEADDPEDVVDQDLMLLGKGYFDCREYARAAHALKDCRGNKARFLCLYSEFLAAEKTIQQDASPTLGKCLSAISTSM